jgi:hypothetical protein
MIDLTQDQKEQILNEFEKFLIMIGWMADLKREEL